MRLVETRIRQEKTFTFVWLVMCCAAFSVSLTGCQGLVPVENSIPVVEGHQPDDIPAPLGFELDDDSWSYLKFEHAPLPMRTVEVIYWGDRPVIELSSWYKDQMPIHGWEYVSAEDDFGEQHIRYRKAGEYADVLIKRMPDKNGENYVTRLIVRIGVDS
ncbi:MAG: hypothetical protein VX404_01130 [Planctomycetota bacterium]|nr:hypothetical protein [Planctomycetota bacterium]NRA74814.1 hypothetical protein [Planctomycetota bacterium]